MLQSGCIVTEWMYCYGVEIAPRTLDYVNSITKYETGSFGYEVRMSQLLQLSLSGSEQILV